uniref:Vestigial like family member 4 n=1 Tax=Corvus moneduloides TaxID=1196302 RepID=A0A8C3E685_CORMO
METPLDVLSRAASLVHADDEKHVLPRHLVCIGACLTPTLQFSCCGILELSQPLCGWRELNLLGPAGGMLTCTLFLLHTPNPGCSSRGEAALRGEPRMQPLPVSPALSNHRTGPPPISPSKRKLSMDQGDEELDCENDHVSKMSRMFNPHLTKTANGDYRKEHRERSRSPIERAAAPTMSLHANHMYASIPSLSMEQPLALTKNSMDAARTVGISPSLSSVERQQCSTSLESSALTLLVLLLLCLKYHQRRKIPSFLTDLVWGTVPLLSPVLLPTTGTATCPTAPSPTAPAPGLPTGDPPAPPLPVTRWWRSTSAGASARTTRSLSRWQTRCPSQGQWMTTLPKHWGTHGCRSRLPRTGCRAALSRRRGGARRPLPPTWSITITRPPWSPEDRTLPVVNLHGLTELGTVLK